MTPSFYADIYRVSGIIKTMKLPNQQTANETCARTISDLASGLASGFTIGPTPKSLIPQRDAMLQKSLRPDSMEFNIAAEYPLVLDQTTSALATSFSVFTQDSVAGHANLFARRFTFTETGESFNIGLVGNVATDAAWRGRGLMRMLFDEITSQAQSQGLSVLVLWSDLLEFYQKLGFTSLGLEHRYHLLRAGCTPSDHQKVRMLAGSRVDHALATELLRLRCLAAGTLERSAMEFQKLLTIPDTFLFVATENSVVHGFAIVGKGADMVGVIHEWGIKNPGQQGDIVALAGSIMDEVRTDELCLLAPSTLDLVQQRRLELAAASVEKVPMALGMKNPQSPQADAAWEALSQGFLWGLDSI